MEIFFIVFIITINLLNLKQSSDRLLIFAKGFLKLPKLHILIKQRVLLPRNLALMTYGKLLRKGVSNSVLNKVKSAISPLSNGQEVFSSASDKEKLFLKNFSKNSNLDDLGISLPVFLLELI